MGHGQRPLIIPGLLNWLTIAMLYHHRSPPWVLFIHKSLSVRYWSLMKLSLLVDNYQGSFDKSENPLFPVPRQNRNDITIVILTHVIDRVNFSKAFPCFLKFTSLLQLIPYFRLSSYFRMQYIQFTAGLPNGEEGQNPPDSAHFPFYRSYFATCSELWGIFQELLLLRWPHFAQAFLSSRHSCLDPFARQTPPPDMSDQWWWENW